MGGENKGRRRRTAFGPVVPCSAFASDKRVRLEQRAGRAGAQPVAHTRLEVDLHAARDILGRRSRVDFGKVRLHLIQKKENKNKKARLIFKKKF